MNDRGGVERLFEELETACGGTVKSITDRVADLTGLDIEIALLEECDWESVARGTLVSDDRARIPLRKSDPRWYRLHVVSHELAHLLCGHARCESLPMTFEDLQIRAGVSVLAGASAPGGGAAPSGGMVAGQPDQQQPEQQQPEQQEAEAERLSRRLTGLLLVPRVGDAGAPFG